MGGFSARHSVGSSFGECFQIAISGLVTSFWYKQCFGEENNGVFIKNGSLFLLYFEARGGFDPPMAQTKALAVAITEMRCSIMAKMSTNSSKMHLWSIPANSNC